MNEIFVHFVCLNAYEQLLRYNSSNSEYHLYTIFAFFSQLLLLKLNYGEVYEINEFKGLGSVC